MSAKLRQLLTDHALGAGTQGVVEDLIRLEDSGFDLDDAFFDGFDWRQRNRIYTIVSLFAAPEALAILKRRLTVEENNFCRRGLEATIEALTTPIGKARADYAAACQLYSQPVRSEEFKREFRGAIQSFAANPGDAGTRTRIKELEPDEGNFEDELFDSLAAPERLAVYQALPKWCPQADWKKILDRRAPLEKDTACHAAIAKMLEPLSRPPKRFNWKPRD